MSELNGNEKYADLPTTLPTAHTNPGPIAVGDQMLYGSRTLVLWYEDYSTTYTYTRIGSVGEPEGLAVVVGREGVSVVFAVDDTGGNGTTAAATSATGTLTQVTGASSSSSLSPGTKLRMPGFTKKS